MASTDPETTSIKGWCVSCRSLKRCDGWPSSHFVIVGHRRNRAAMRWSYVILVLVFVFGGHGSAVLSDVDSNLSLATSHGTTPRSKVGAQSKSAVDKRFLRASEVSANSPYSTNENEEARDVTASKVIGVAADAIKMKAKLNIMLVRGLKPARVLEKLSVYRVSDKNFNNFARYYAKYLAKYSSKMPDLPKTAEDALVQPKLKDWLAHGLLPAQVEVQLKKLATTNVNRYMQLYLKEADNALILPKLERWMGQKLLPSQFKYNLNEIGIKDTTKYMDWYMRNGGDAVMKAKLRSWLGKKVLPPQIGPKLRKAGLTDIQEYAALYMRMWGKRQAELSRLANLK